jgi:hypothetical protein
MPDDFSDCDAMITRLAAHIQGADQVIASAHKQIRRVDDFLNGIDQMRTGVAKRRRAAD